MMKYGVEEVHENFLKDPEKLGGGEKISIICQLQFFVAPMKIKI